MFRYLRRTFIAFSLVLVTLTVPNAGQAGPKELTETEAVALLRTYDIVRGDDSGNMRLGDRLTRAQAAAIFVRAMGKDQFTSALAGSVPFTDAVGHWAAGDIAMADRLGLMRGNGNGMFQPDREITYAEILTVLLRIVEQEPQGRWSADLIQTQAARLGLFPEGVSVTEPAVRGKTFWSLAVATSSIPLSSGQTVLQKYVDNVPPQLHLDQSSFTTTDESVTISGSVSNGNAVSVNGSGVGLDNTGRFRYVAKLALGKNTFKVEAADAAGNRVAESVSAERRTAYARLEVTGPKSLQAGTTVKLDVVAYDNKDNIVPTNELKATLSGDVATFSPDTRILTTGNKAGRGVLTLSVGTVSKTFTFDVTKPSDQAVALSIQPINNSAALTAGKDYTVKVNVSDANGGVVTDDFWRTVTLSVSGSGSVWISDETLSTEAGTATFKVKAVTKGNVSFSASSPDLTTASASTQVLSPIRVVLSATPGQLTPDGVSAASIRATLQDANGRTVQNTSGQDIRVELWPTDSLGIFTDATLTIRQGASTSSGDDAVLRAGTQAGTSAIQGETRSAHDYSVLPFSLPVTGRLSGVKLQVVVPQTSQRPSESTVPVTVKVLNAQGQLVTTGSYAFQLAVASSNPDPVTNGLPEGVEIGFSSNSDYYPVDDNRSTTDPQNNPYSVVGRTYQGTASLYLRYAKSGVITLTPSLVQGTDSAYHPTTGLGPASASAGMTATPAQVTFAGTAARIKLTVDSAIGRDLEGGATGPVSTGMTIRARVVDENGTVVPGYTNAITLTRSSTGNRVTRIAGTNGEFLRKSLVNNMAEWSIQTTGTPGYDIYTATATGLGSATVSVAVRGVSAAAPTIIAIRGSRNGDPSPDLGVIGPDDDFMDIQIGRQDPPNGESAYWVAAKVYRRGQANPIFTGAVDLSQDPPIVRVPRANLTVGTDTYEVVLHNGVRDSARSPDPGFGLNRVSVAQYEAAYRLTGGLFDRATGRLTLSTSGLSGNGAVDIQKLFITKGSNRLTLSTLNTTVVSIGYSSVVLQSAELAAALNSESFYGAVNIEAEAGWYSDASQGRIAGQSTVPMRPSAIIAHATVDDATRTLYLYGEGFLQGSLFLNQIRLGTVPLRPGSGTEYDSATDISDTLVTVRLSQATLNAIRAIPGQSLTLSADMGWLRISDYGSTYQAAAVSGRPVYVRALVTGASYDKSRSTLTLRGIGFANAQIDPLKLQFRAAGTQSSYRLDNTATAAVVDGGTVKIQLSTQDAAHFAGLADRSVFLNTDDGWLTDSARRPAIALPTDSVLFTVPSL